MKRRREEHKVQKCQKNEMERQGSPTGLGFLGLEDLGRSRAAPHGGTLGPRLKFDLHLRDL